MATSPTQNSLKWWRSLGYKTVVVEHWNPFAKIRQDLFGIIDLVALGHGEVVGIQTTSGKNHAARIKKLLAHENSLAWVMAGGKLCVQSWNKVGKFWKERTDWITVEAIQNANAKMGDSGEGQVAE